MHDKGQREGRKGRVFTTEGQVNSPVNSPVNRAENGPSVPDQTKANANAKNNNTQTKPGGNTIHPTKLPNFPERNMN